MLLLQLEYSLLKHVALDLPFFVDVLLNTQSLQSTFGFCIQFSGMRNMLALKSAKYQKINSNRVEAFIR